VIEDNLRSGAECGLSLAVDIDGRTVVDVYGGFADWARTRPWGGSMIIMDLDRRVTISYMMNKMQPGVIGSALTAAYCTAVYRLLG
jgi:hypothetical protein